MCGSNPRSLYTDLVLGFPAGHRTMPCRSFEMTSRIHRSTDCASFTPVSCAIARSVSSSSKRRRSTSRSRAEQSHHFVMQPLAQLSIHREFLRIGGGGLELRRSFQRRLAAHVHCHVLIARDAGVPSIGGRALREHPLRAAVQSRVDPAVTREQPGLAYKRSLNTSRKVSRWI